MQFVMHLSTKVLLGTCPPKIASTPNLYIWSRYTENNSRHFRESKIFFNNSLSRNNIWYTQVQLSRFVRIDNTKKSFLAVVWILFCMLFYPTTFEKLFTIWCPAVWKWAEDQRIRGTMRLGTNWLPWNLRLAAADLCEILDEESPKNAWKMECQPLTIFAPEEPMASMEAPLLASERLSSLQCKLCRSWRAVLSLPQPTFISKLSPGKLRLAWQRTLWQKFIFCPKIHFDWKVTFLVHF